MTAIKAMTATAQAVRSRLEAHRYICSEQIATAVYLAYHLHKPVLIEGPPGVGKTELAKTTAAMFSLPLIRLQCYEGLDEAKAIYEWKYGKQLLYTQVLKETLDEVLQGAKGFAESVNRLHEFGDIFFSEEFMEPRPLLKALRERDGCVLLIDEVDKADHEFESLLLEILSDYQVSIPEIGTVKAITEPPMVFLTSNNSRELSDALKRRCLHLYIPFPDTALEQRIIQARVPDIPPELRRQLVQFIQDLRGLDLKKAPAISETIDWGPHPSAAAQRGAEPRLGAGDAERHPQVSGGHRKRAGRGAHPHQQGGEGVKAHAPRSAPSASPLAAHP